jgi:hypothetical protein
MEYTLDYYKNMFSIKFDELERCHNNLTNYSLIQASNPIRSLLYDSRPLVDILSREKKTKMVYTVSNHNFPPGEEDGLTELLFWREVCPNFYDTIDLSRKDFFKWPVVWYVGKSITVFDVLKFYAYVRGGIHLDKGKEEYEHLREAFNLIKINQLSSLDHSMRGIVQVIYTTLKNSKEQLLYGCS